MTVAAVPPRGRRPGPAARLAALVLDRPVPATIAAVLPVSVYALAILTRGGFATAPEMRYGYVFNDMLLDLPDGQFDIDRRTIGVEGYEVDCRIYPGFGILGKVLESGFVHYYANVLTHLGSSP
jgi:hypothetical protein